MLYRPRQSELHYIHYRSLRVHYGTSIDFFSLSSAAGIGTYIYTIVGLVASSSLKIISLCPNLLKFTTSMVEVGLVNVFTVE